MPQTPHTTDRIVVILGPTAGGKSDLAVAVAQRFGGEIINADSMQVYRQLDAGTAKPTAEQRQAVTHHLVNCVDPTDSWTVADWLESAEQLIADMQSRNVLPVVCGGTNLYIKALLEGMFQGPPADPAYRDSLRDIDPPRLHEQLQQIDPAAADRIKPMDRKRIVRALEVYHVTGKRISELQNQWEGTKGRRDGGTEGEDENHIRHPTSDIRYRYDPILIGLRWPVELINRRINARVRLMFHPPAGVEDLASETRRLLEADQLGPQAREAIGTRQVLDHLAGRCTLDEAFERVKIDTRRFAKQQRTWLKRYRGVHWLAADRLPADELTEQAIQIVADELKE